MYNVSPLSWIGIPDISSLGHYNIWQWYTYVCLHFGGCFFRKFGIVMGGFHERQISSNYINWVYPGLEKNRQNGKLLARKFGDLEGKNKEIHKGNHPTLEGNLPCWRESLPSLQGNKHFGQNWVLFFQKWYTDGWEIGQKTAIEKVRFLRSDRHIHVWYWWK